MSKFDWSGRDASADMPTPRTNMGRPPGSDAPQHLPDVGAPPPRRSDGSEARSSSSDNDDKKLIVGRGIVLTGEIRACDRLVVEGQVGANLDSRSIEIAESGVFKGTAQIDTAEISGRFEGDITVKQRLTVHATGRLIGMIRYCEIEIERGGILSGTLKLLGDETIEMPLAETSRLTERRSAASAEPARTTARQRTTPSSSR